MQDRNQIQGYFEVTGGGINDEYGHPGNYLEFSLPNTSETGTPKMMTEIETEAQREGTGMQNKGKGPGAQTGTVPALPTLNG